MSYLELLLFLMGMIFPFLLSWNIKKGLNTFLLGLMILAFLLHAFVDGFRWQMLPIYLICLVLLICLARRKAFFAGGGTRRVLTGFFLVVLLFFGYSLPTILPVFDLDPPSGKYEVGSTYFHLSLDREEVITEEFSDKRELSIKAWYPADPKKEDIKEEYLTKAERIGFARKYGLPANSFEYLTKVESNTFETAEPAKGKFPVLIFSHGYHTKANVYYALLEEIVSQGYIVLGVNHTYESVGSSFPDGEMKFYSQEFNDKFNNQESATMIWEAMEGYKEANTKEEKAKLLKKPMKEYFAADITERWAVDLSDVMDHLSDWEQEGILSGHMDLDKVGVFGHSQGGAAAGQTLLDDDRFLAGINIDGTQWGTMIDTFLSKPFLLISSDWPDDHPNWNEQAFQREGPSDFYSAKIKNSGHSSFMDIPFMMSLPMLNEAGSIDPRRAIEISTRMIVGFFDKYLKGGSFAVNEDDMEVEWKVRSMD